MAHLNVTQLGHTNKWFLRKAPLRGQSPTVVLSCVSIVQSKTDSDHLRFGGDGVPEKPSVVRLLFCIRSESLPVIDESSRTWFAEQLGGGISVDSSSQRSRVVPVKTFVSAMDPAFAASAE